MKKMFTKMFCVMAVLGFVGNAYAEPVVYELSNSKLHVFPTHNPLNDMAFIIEGKDSVVVLEQPSFQNNIKDFDAYTKSIGKPVVKVIADYHPGGVAVYPAEIVLMPEAMIEFGKGPQAQAMFGNFQKNFGDAMDLRPLEGISTFPVPSKQNYAGIDFEFLPGPSNDFPAASIIIDNDAYYTHLGASKSHASPLQIKNAESIDIVLAELARIKASNVKHVFGSHGIPATMTEVDFQLEYYGKMKSLLAANKTAEDLKNALVAAYPDLPVTPALDKVVGALYAN